MDPLVAIIYVMIAAFFWAEGIMWRSLVRDRKNGEDVKYLCSLTAGLSVSTFCLLVSFSIAVNGTVYDQFGPRGLLGAANCVLCVILILLAAFRLRSPSFKKVFVASLLA
jgi:hypothetical protein